MNKFFYSNKCNDCRDLWKNIENMRITHMFTPICLDGMSVQEINSLKLRVVPTIISINDGNATISEGKQKCNLMINKIASNQPTNNQPTNNQPSNNQMSDTRGVNKKDAPEYKYENKYYEHDPELEYCEQEMDGFGDCYSYNTDNNYMPKNYVKVGEEEENYITAPLTKNKENESNALKYNPTIDDQPQKYIQTEKKQINMLEHAMQGRGQIIREQNIKNENIRGRNKKPVNSNIRKRS